MFRIKIAFREIDLTMSIAQYLRIFSVPANKYISLQLKPACETIHSYAPNMVHIRSMAIRIQAGIPQPAVASNCKLESFEISQIDNESLSV